VRAANGSSPLVTALDELSGLAGDDDRGAHITRGSMLLCNESFASTNERGGSEIARRSSAPCAAPGSGLFFVTHLYDLARGCYAEPGPSALFLRAERQPGGRRTFRLAVGEPLPTSHGQDVYADVFGPPAGAAPPPQEDGPAPGIASPRP
jgi:hypothetical protein